MIEKTPQKEIVLRFEAGWINMHMRDGDECVSTLQLPRAAQHALWARGGGGKCEWGGRTLNKKAGLKMSVRWEPAKIDEDDGSPQRRHTKIWQKNKNNKKPTPHPTNSSGFVFIASQQ